jgi:hypothetical protein
MIHNIGLSSIAHYNRIVSAQMYFDDSSKQVFYITPNVNGFDETVPAENAELVEIVPKCTVYKCDCFPCLKSKISTLLFSQSSNRIAFKGDTPKPSYWSSLVSVFVIILIIAAMFFALNKNLKNHLK